MRLQFFFIFLFFVNRFCCAQSTAIDTITNTTNKSEQRYNVGKGKTYIYTKPKNFSFLTNVPKDFVGIGKTAFKKNALKPWLLLATSSAILILGDQAITDGVEKFSSNIHLNPKESYKDILKIKVGSADISLYKAPQNINTALYQLGQGFPSLILGGGLFIYGRAHKDYRALNTANQLAEAFIVMGVGTQVIKRITGRQTPLASTSNGGNWNPFPTFKAYQTRTPEFDAFPSGHLATLMSTVTVLTENYPEKKWIKPVGYSLTGLVAYSMINNKVHWAGDYPMAIALGYLCAKQVVKRNRRVETNGIVTAKKKGSFSYSFDYANGRLMPAIIYKF
jgi:PAP2 superfamily